MDLFTLVGTVSIDTKDANDKLDALIEKAGLVATTLNGGEAVVVSGGTTTTTSGNTTTTTTGTKTTTGGAVANTGTNVQVSAAKVAMGNWLTQIGNYVFREGKEFTQAGFEFNRDMEKWASSFKTFLYGDEGAAQALLEDIRQFAIDTPLSLKGSVEQATKLLATGTAPENLIDTMRVIGDLSNGQSDTFSRVGTAYWQIMSTGRLLSQDANQLTQAGVPVWQLMADYFNVIGRDGMTDWDSQSVRELAQLAAQLKDPELAVTSEEFAQAMEYATSENGMYFNAMNNAMDTEAGRSEKYGDALEQLAGNLAKGHFEVFSEETLPAVTETVADLNEWAIENKDSLTAAAKGMSNFVTNTVDFAATAFPGLTDFLSAGGIGDPIGAGSMLSGMGLLTHGLLTGNIKTGLSGAFLTLNSTATNLKQMIDAFSEQGINSVGEAFDAAQRNLDNRATALHYLFGTGAFEDWEYTTPFEEWLNKGMNSIPGEGNTRGVLGPGEYHESPYTIVDGKLVLTNPDALEDNGYLREANPWEQFMLGFNDFFFGEDAKENYEKQNGLREDDRTFDELSIFEKGKAELEVLMAGLFGSPEELEAVLHKYRLNDDETDDEGSAEPTGDSRRYPGESDAFLLMTGHPERIVPDDDDDSDGTSGSRSIGGVLASIQSTLASLPSEVQAAASAGVAEGVGSITITGTITTGDVTLDTGVVAGEIAPQLDLRLGAANARAARMG